jgi:twitching motility two-component system response regulator PilG
MSFHRPPADNRKGGDSTRVAVAGHRQSWHAVCGNNNYEAPAARLRAPGGAAAGIREEERTSVSESSTGAVKVLVIDDSNTIRRSAELFLRQAGFEVILAEDGFDALAKISDHQPQVIFVDIMMPRLDGYQTCALIKQNPSLKSTPVIMLSSKDGVFDRARGRLAGSDRYLTKPFTKEGLIDAVKEYARPSAIAT